MLHIAGEWFKDEDGRTHILRGVNLGGGNHFAPNTQIDGDPAQEALQRHYIGALPQVALRRKGMPHVLGTAPKQPQNVLYGFMLGTAVSPI